jgi:hypothetical protein
MLNSLQSKADGVLLASNEDDLRKAGWEKVQPDARMHRHIATGRIVSRHPAEDLVAVQHILLEEYSENVKSEIEKLKEDISEMQQSDASALKLDDSDYALQGLHEFVKNIGMVQATKHLRIPRSLPLPSSHGICFRTKSEDGDWTTAKYCMCPLIGENFQSVDPFVNAQFAWLTRSATREPTWVEEPAGPFATIGVNPKWAKWIVPSVTTDPFKMLKDGPSDQISGPFDLKGHSHNMFEIVVPVSGFTVGLKALKTRDPCSLHLYEPSKTTEYISRSRTVREGERPFVAYLEGAFEMGLTEIGEIANEQAVAASLAQKQTGNPSSLAEMHMNSTMEQALAAQTSLRSMYQEAMDEALKESNHAATLMQAMDLKIQDSMKAWSDSADNVPPQRSQSDIWASLEQHAKSHVFLKYMPAPQAKGHTKLGKFFTREDARCTLSKLINQALDNVGSEKGACSMPCFAGKCGGSRLGGAKPLANCGTCMGQGMVCKVEKPFPTGCPLRTEVVQKLQELWTKLDLKFRRKKSQVYAMCQATLLDAGLWLARPDTKLKLSAIIDLQNWGSERRITVKREQQNRKNLISISLSDGTKINLMEDLKRQNIQMTSKHAPHLWATPEDAQLMDSLFIRLQKRVQMCKVVKNGVFNFHFEAQGSLGADIGRFLGKQHHSGNVAALFISEAAVTVYKHKSGSNLFAGHHMGDAALAFGDPERGANPEAWWEEMRHNVENLGWTAKKDEFGSDVCLLCKPTFAVGNSKNYTNKTFPLVTGVCDCGSKEIPYVHTDPEGDAPFPRFLSWTKKAKEDLVQFGDLRGLWHVDRTDWEMAFDSQGQLPNQFHWCSSPAEFSFSIGTSSVIGLHSYDKEQAKADTRKEFIKGNIYKEKPGFDYNADLLDHCFIMAVSNLPEETDKGWHLGDYTRLRLCTNHWSDRFEKNHPLRNPDLPHLHGFEVTTERDHILLDLRNFVSLVSTMVPSLEDGEGTGQQPRGVVGQPQCFPISQEDRDAGTCMAGLDFIPGFNASCVENPENPCPEGTKCTCDMELGTVSGKTKFALAFLTVQSIQFFMWLKSTGNFQVALSTQLAAGPGDVVNSFVLLSLLEGKKQCKCLNSGFPMLSDKKETYSKGCLFQPNTVGDGRINHFNSYWFLPAPGTKLVPGPMSMAKGFGVGTGILFMGGNTFIPSETLEAIPVETKIGALVGAGLAGAIASRWLASCHVETCKPTDFTVGWVDGQGFANCNNYVYGLEYRERLSYYDEKLSSDPKKVNIEKVIDDLGNKQPVSEHRKWELALRVEFPKHFGMPAGRLTQGTPEFTQSIGYWIALGNPAMQLVLGVANAGLGIIDDAFAFAMGAVKQVGSAFRAPILVNSKLQTTRLIVNYYYDHCMAMKCMTQMHSAKGRIGGIKPSSSQKATCKTELWPYSEQNFESEAFEELRIQHILKNYIADGDETSEKKSTSHMSNVSAFPAQ